MHAQVLGEGEEECMLRMGRLCMTQERGKPKGKDQGDIKEQ